MSRVVFFYFHGTDALISQFFAAVGRSLGQPSLGLLTVPGIDGKTTTWVDGSVSNDPFVSLLDPNIFEAYSVGYPALGLGMKASIDTGVAKLTALIDRLPAGQKYMVGGYSQGAAVAGTCYSKIKSGELGTKAANDFLGGVCFGSPIRQTNFRGEVGGTWSGSWDSGVDGHGCFPADGPIPRLTGCDPTQWIEFAEYDDVITSTGDSQDGIAWTNGASVIVNLFNGGAAIPAILAAITTYWDGINRGLAIAGRELPYVDATGREFNFPGNGHTAYPWRHPPGDPDNGLTSFQIAVKWLTSKALQYATSPILLPQNPNGDSTTTAGWSTALTAP